MSIVSNSIINADAEARYLSPGELDQIKAFVTGGQRRLRVAQVLCESRERIVKQAGGQLFQKRPDVISPGGNAYGEEMTATCLRDMDYYLRLVTYGVVAGDITPIEEIGVIGAKELYRSLGTNLEAMALSVREMKNVAMGLLSGEDAEEAGFYFDYVIGASFGPAASCSSAGRRGFGSCAESVAVARGGVGARTAGRPAASGAAH